MLDEPASPREVGTRAAESPSTDTAPAAAPARPAEPGLSIESVPGLSIESAPRLVTVFFSDLKGSTSLGEKLDSEALREVLARYFDAMTDELEWYGATIEKFIGDAIMAVFGLPEPRPDDAVRAVTAAAATKRALAKLNDELEMTYGVRLVNRTGLATGYATFGIAREGEHVLTGDVVRLASRLEQTAPPGEIQLAEGTLAAITATGAMPVVEAVEPPVASEASYVLVSEPDQPADASARAAGNGARKIRETRRTVSIVFCDLHATDAEGGPLPPGPLRTALTRGFDVARAALERHGATVEKYVGDAVMAVFGMPVIHEDDALRAVRAAAAMRAAVATLAAELAPAVRLTSRTGVNTGEVVAGDATLGQRLVTGDTVNTAARLEQAAKDNDILLGGSTWSLVRDAVEADSIEPLSLKGKAALVAAYRLTAIGTLEARPRANESPMVGRDEQLQALRARFAESVHGRTPRFVTVVGDAGIGKSRLVREFERTIDGATMLRGRCLSYGEGITFWPIREMVKTAAGIDDDDAPLAAGQKIAGVVGEQDVADRLASILGLTSMPFPMAELFWAVRRFCEILAERRPLVLAVDGVHWASPAFVDLLDHLRTTLGESPVLVILIARHELLEAQPEWGASARDTLIELGPLAPEHTVAILDRLLGAPDASAQAEPSASAHAGASGGATATADRPASPGSAGHPAHLRRADARVAALAARILDVAQGNPLYVEQVVSMLIDTGALRLEDGRWLPAPEASDVAVPPTIQALLAARVDAVPPAERQVLDPASVIGQSFAEPAVEALVDEDARAEVPNSLRALEARQLVRRDAASSAAEPWFRFQNLLIRDAAYRALLKRSRATLHERFVAWADAINRERGREREFEEISGYHLEQSYRYRRELGQLDGRAIEVGRDAARRLTSAGRRAFARGDMAAAANLLGRSVDVLQADDPDRRDLLPELGEAFLELGEFDRAAATLGDASSAADVAGDDRLRANAGLVRLLLEFYTGDASGWARKATGHAREAIDVFERLEDHTGLTRAWRVLCGVNLTACRYGDAADAAEQIVRHATLAGDRRQEARGATGFAQAALQGPMPVAEAIDRCRELLERVNGDRRSEAMVLLVIAELEGMAGWFDAARQRAALARSMLVELGPSVVTYSTSANSWRIHYLAGDLEAAERELRADYDALGQVGERFVRSSIAALLGQVVLKLGRVDEAEILADEAREMTDDDDITTQAFWRSLKAGVLASRALEREDFDVAIELARGALEVLRPADSIVFRADALVDLADVLRSAGRIGPSCDALVEAYRLYVAKGATAAAEQTRIRLSAEGREGDVVATAQGAGITRDAGVP